VEEDTLGYMNGGWVDGLVDGEYQGYALSLTQANSANIPSSDTFGDCYSRQSFKVAVIDSGIQFDHADMPCQDTKQGSTNCVGRSFGTNDDWSYAYDAWHATHVMGIMGATGGNNQGTTSVMPTDNNICWVVGQVFPDTNSEHGTHLSSVYKAVVWSIGSKGAKVVNMSLSGGYTETGQKVMDYAKLEGAIVVAGAGNSNTFQYEYPASYANDNVLSVGAIDAERYVHYCSVLYYLE
jgi:hypothetical protein